MTNIVYLLGAGASALAIPTVNEMNVELGNQKAILESYLETNLNVESFGSLPISFRENYKQLAPLIEDFKWLINESANHETVDTVAKKFYLLNDYQSLKRLKTTLIIYFTIKQLCKLPGIPNSTGILPRLYPLIDQRYDSFIAAMAEKRDRQMQLRANVKIITWNYDIQVELSLKRYLNKKVHALKEEFQIFPNHNSFSLGQGDLIDQSRFGMIKLNGNAFWDNPSETGEELKTTLFDEFFENKEPVKVLGHLLYQLHWLHANNDKLIDEAVKYFNFAWESDSTFTNRYDGYVNNISEANRIAAEVEVLVIIGYSFPIFNRSLDGQLFERMTKLRRVYIQDVRPKKIQSLISNAFSIFQGPHTQENPPKSFQLEDNTDHFVIPFEL